MSPSYHGWTHAPKEMGGTDPIPFTGAVYHFVVFDDTVPVAAGDSAFIFHIPADLDGMRLADVEINVETASSSGIVQVQFHNMEQAVDMLSTRVQVDANELHSKDASTAGVVNDANAVVAHGDRIRVDVDSAGTGTLGLDCVLRFYTVAGFSLRGPQGVQGETGPTGPQGPQGNPGGITAWEGEWQTSTGYSEGDAVSHNGSSYAARQDHTSGATSEPGVGASWETYWLLLAEAPATAADVPIVDSGDYFTGTEVEAALQQIGTTLAAQSFWDATIIKQVDESVTSSTTLQNDDELTFSVVEGALYEFELALAYTSAGAADIKHSITVSAGQFNRVSRHQFGFGPTTAVNQHGALVDESTATPATIVNAGTSEPMLVLVHGFFTVSADATFSVQWAQQSSNGTPTYAHTGSRLSYRVVYVTV